MSTRLKIKEEKIFKILTSLSEESLNGTPIIVEGKKDVNALRMLGVKGIIITVKTKGKSFLDVISEIQKTNVSAFLVNPALIRRKYLENIIRHSGISLIFEK